jgi:hypothetical protein
MDKMKRFFELKELWKQSSEAERADIDRELTELMDSMNETELEALTTGVEHDFERIHREAGDIQRTLTIRQQMEPILPYISVSSLAKDYFGKSTSWFYQRLNGNIIHGKTASFTEKEIQTLNDALQEIGAKLMKLSVTI